MKSLTRTFQSQCSRRREEADTTQLESNPPRHLGGYTSLWIHAACISKLTLPLLVWLFLALPLSAGVQQAWIARYTASATGTNQAVAIALDKDGNVIVGGHGTSTNGDFDYSLLKYAPSGTRLWVADYNSAPAARDEVRAMSLDQDANAYVTGTTKTLKYDRNGVMQWDAPYGARGLALDPSGDVCITGFSATTFATAKIHKEAGTNLWLKTYSYLNRPGYVDISQVIAVDGGSNVFVAGQVVCYAGRPGDAYASQLTISYDSSGNQRWVSNPFPNDCLSYQVNVKAIAADALGNAYFTANLFGLHQTYSTTKYSELGSPEWRYYLDPANFDGVQAMILGKDGSPILTGSSGRCVTVKLGSNGVPEWTRRYGSTQTGYHFGKALALDSIGNVYVTGQAPGVGTGNDYATIKYSPDGQELWVQRYDGPAHGDDVATAIAVAPDGSVYVTGWSTTSSNLVEITTIKYVQTASLTVETNRNVNLQFIGTPGQSNRVQATTDFLGWLDLGFSLADTNGLLHFQDTNAPSFPFRFYRTVSP